MKCILFNSPIYREHNNTTEEYLPPLGLGYIATQLYNVGVDVELVDCVKERLGVKEILKFLKQHPVDYIGLNIFTQNFDIVKEIVEQCPITTNIIIGGQVVKCIYEDILRWNTPNSLTLIIGDGELILPALINGICIESPIVSVNQKHVYKVDRNSVYYPNNLNSVWLDRTLFNQYAVKNHFGDIEASIITSRGCIYNCAFCGGSHSLNTDVTIRYRSITDIENEITEIITANPSVTSIRVLDDLFLRNETSINDAIRMFERFESLSWRGMAHVLTFANALKTLPKLKMSGCRELFIGIESGSDTMRKRINKLGTVQQVKDVISAILESGIDVKGYFMFGLPNETISDAEDTYVLASALAEISQKTKGNFRTSVFQFRPYHGTQLYNEILNSGRLIPPITSNSSLNLFTGRTQFNFQSGNYSSIEDTLLHEYIIKTQALSRAPNV